MCACSVQVTGEQVQLATEVRSLAVLPSTVPADATPLTWVPACLHPRAHHQLPCLCHALHTREACRKSAERLRQVHPSTRVVHAL